ncbi:hypothetical protein H8N03_25045 [Ramlibacter sp. USB13]|uniref:Uncharacterized protein n=1 Tax=Ramlibacter cellulosilyticus TaxID=2764187 RepID=A0A923MWZ6_9BURK|nr:hypothetical protein [Ramlibacter cellulosilyticus]MBC5786228.1 hypothetical protein [Ramlibacter cellulosilyticus]
MNLMTGNRGKGGDKVTLMVLDWNAMTSVKTLAQVSQDVAEGVDGWVTFMMPGGGVPVPAQWVALQLSAPTAIFWWKYQTGNPYPGGNYFLGGYGDGANDYLFRTYGTPACSGTPPPGSFTLAVSPDPVALARGGSRQATVSVARQGTFTGPVNVTFTLPSGVTASPSSLSVAGSTAGVTLTASATAGTGTFTATARGTASGVAPAQDSFKVSVGTSAAAPSLAGVSPAVQQRGGTITLTLGNIGGAGFSLCSTGLVFHGNGSSVPRVYLRDLESGSNYQASPVAAPVRVPRLPAPYSENYQPRFLRSPDGTLLLVVTAAPQSGTGNAMATFLDKAAGGTVLRSMPITTNATIGTSAVSANVGTDNRLTLRFASQSFGPYALP